MFTFPPPAAAGETGAGAIDHASNDQRALLLNGSGQFVARAVLSLRAGFEFVHSLHLPDPALCGHDCESLPPPPLPPLHYRVWGKASSLCVRARASQWLLRVCMSKPELLSYISHRFLLSRAEIRM